MSDLEWQGSDPLGWTNWYQPGEPSLTSSCTWVDSNQAHAWFTVACASSALILLQWSREY